MSLTISLGLLKTKAKADNVISVATKAKQQFELRITSIGMSKGNSAATVQKLNLAIARQKNGLVGIDASLADPEFSDPVMVEELQRERSLIVNKLEGLELRSAGGSVESVLDMEMDLAIAQASLTIVNDFIAQVTAHKGTLAE